MGLHTAFNSVRYLIAIATIALALQACATRQVTPPADIESWPEAVTVPYSLSAGGHFVLDIAINGKPPQPFVVDTGAAVSILFDEEIEALDLAVTDQTILISGLVAREMRPVIENVDFQIGSQIFQLDRIAVLETPLRTYGAIGLLGADILADNTILFNKETMKATIIPSKSIKRSTFQGWRRIQLHSQVGSYPDKGVHFAYSALDNKKVPVLIDTGSNVNIINWPLATLDKNIRRLQKSLRESVELHGAIDTSAIKIETLFHDLVLGNHYWPSTEIIITELDSLSSVGPVHEPMMIAGASMFTQWSVAFDLGGNVIYIHAGPDAPKPPTDREILPDF